MRTKQTKTPKRKYTKRSAKWSKAGKTEPPKAQEEIPTLGKPGVVVKRKTGKPGGLRPWKESRRYRELALISTALQIRGASHMPLVGTEQIAYGLRLKEILDRQYKKSSPEKDNGEDA